MKNLVLIFSLFVSFNALAVTIEFPKEELARESVLPVFDNTVAVKSRLVPTDGRFEIGLSSGVAMNEPFFNSVRFGGYLGYHFNETHSFMISGLLYQEGLGNNGSALAATDLQEGTGETFIRMNFAPQPKSQFLLNYQITPYYGKISIFKNFVMNLSLYGLLGAGVVDIGGETTPAFQVGMGQKFYFSKWWGIRADLGLLAYEGVNFFLGKGGATSPLQDTSGSNADNVTQTVPVSEFEREFNYDLSFVVSLIFLL